MTVILLCNNVTPNLISFRLRSMNALEHKLDTNRPVPVEAGFTNGADLN
ncbi:MAG: hypothetical protein AAF554_09995 [Bacteroidota bacterium]